MALSPPHRYYTWSRNIRLRQDSLDYFKVNCAAPGSKQDVLFEHRLQP